MRFRDPRRALSGWNEQRSKPRLHSQKRIFQRDGRSRLATRSARARCHLAAGVTRACVRCSQKQPLRRNPQKSSLERQGPLMLITNLEKFVAKGVSKIIARSCKRPQCFGVIADSRPGPASDISQFQGPICRESVLFRSYFGSLQTIRYSSIIKEIY